MQGGEVPRVEDIPAATDQAILDLYSNVIGELMTRSRERHRDHWGPEQGLVRLLAAVEDEVLLGVYRAVHDEMMVRHAKRPGLWEPRDDEGDQP
ncbi:MAG TPA: hypothetical protein VGC37_18505 [Friedmanniella sp.]